MHYIYQYWTLGHIIRICSRLVYRNTFWVWGWNVEQSKSCRVCNQCCFHYIYSDQLKNSPIGHQSVALCKAHCPYGYLLCSTILALPPTCLWKHQKCLLWNPVIDILHSLVQKYTVCVFKLVVNRLIYVFTPVYTFKTNFQTANLVTNSGDTRVVADSLLLKCMSLVQHEKCMVQTWDFHLWSGKLFMLVSIRYIDINWICNNLDIVL